VNSTTSASVTSTQSSVFTTSKLFHSSQGDAASFAEGSASASSMFDSGRSVPGLSFQPQTVSSTSSSADSGGARILFGKPVLSAEDQPRETELVTCQQNVDLKTSVPAWEREQKSKCAFP
jgi:hypothetical protein